MHAELQIARQAIPADGEANNREVFLDIGGQLMKVLKNELCPEEYYAYTTEGRERVMVMEYAEKYGSMEKGIEMLVKDKQQKH